MTEQQKAIAKVWYAMGLIDRPDVWPFTKVKPPRRKTQQPELAGLEKALL